MIEILPLGDITVDADTERQRKKMNPQKLDDLQASITKSGLIQPLVVENVEYEDAEFHNEWGHNPSIIKLIAGKRRLTVLGRLIEEYRFGDIFIAPGSAPVIFWNDLDEEQRMEIELDENLHREDLAWPDRVSAIARLQALRTKKAGGKAPTQNETAAIINDKPASEVTSNERAEVSRALVLAQHMESHPELAKAKSEKEAFSMLRKDTINLFMTALNDATRDKEVSSRHTAHYGDALEFLATCPADEYNAVCTDPPYGVGAHTWTPQSGSDSGVQHNYDDDPKVVDPFIKALFVELYRVTAPQAHVFACCDIRRWNEWSLWAAQAGFNPWYVPIIWDKGGVGNIVGNVDGPRRTYEAVLYLRKGGKPINQLFADVIKGVAVGEKTLHAAQKPVELYTFLLKQICMPGDKVLDPCMGSGTIFPAANELRLIATGCEKVEENFLVAKSRLSEGESLNGNLPGI